LSRGPGLKASFAGKMGLVIGGYETVVFEMVTLLGLQVTFTVVFAAALSSSFTEPGVKVIVPFTWAVHVPITIGVGGRRKLAGMFFCSVTGPYEMGGFAEFTVVGMASVDLTSSTVASIVTDVKPIAVSLSTMLAGIVTFACQPVIETLDLGATLPGVVPVSVAGQFDVPKAVEVQL
jgi:hypothetical protein